jgi:phage terminase large subunit GpA-like protein
MNLAGYWQPTAVAIEENHWSYQIGGLYNPPGFDSWADFVERYMEANPDGAPRIEEKYQTFVNIDLGETYSQVGETPKGNDLQKNIRNYKIRTIPEKLSIADGNGKIILITLAADLNGTEHDARLDYEVLAWSESGSNYSIIQGSIGTFVPKEGPIKQDRVHWTYQNNKENSVWPELNKVIETFWEVDTGRRMKIALSGVDCGYHSQFVYNYLDRSNFAIVGLKGKDLDKATLFSADLPPFRPAKERKNLYLIEVNRIKDSIANNMKLKWDRQFDAKQPPNFMNFPIPEANLYLFETYFKHFEAEHKTTEKSKLGMPIAARWVKRQSNSQNHFWDVRGYNMVVRDIFVKMLGDAMKEKNFTWADYCRIVVPATEVKKIIPV